MSGAIILGLAMVLDAALGEPDVLWKRVPHPAVLMGRLIDHIDQRVNHGTNRRLKGVIVMAGLVLGAGILGWIIAALPLGWLWQLLIVAILLAQRSLVDHVRAVARALRNSVPSGRVAVAQIVGRDTAQMQQPDIARAAIESGAENLSDGVVAPAFWFLLFGLPGLLIYKITNTADSMIGYKNDKYTEFGWAAARFDDALNYIPARITAALILITQNEWHSAPIVFRDAPLHRSPNAGWPETAMAVALNVALAGPRSYFGKKREFPFAHRDGIRNPGPADIDEAIRALWIVWASCLGIIGFVALF